MDAVVSDDACEECGNDAPIEGYRVCLECLERLGADSCEQSVDMPPVGLYVTHMTSTANRRRSFDMGGHRNYDALPQAERDAHDFIAWATEQGARREGAGRKGYAADAARHLKATAPDRFARAIASRLAGRADDVYAALVALADEAAANR